MSCELQFYRLAIKTAPEKHLAQSNLPAKTASRPSFSIGLLPVNILVASGVLLVLTGLLHVPMLLISGGSWEGSVSWRKPILFGISTGMTLWSLGWILIKLKRWKVDTLVSWIVALALVIEVGLITMQQWRGQASHFNQETSFDAVVDMAMVAFICIAVAGILWFTFRSFGSLDLSADYAFAVRSGMVFLVLSCAIGFAISFYGYERLEAGLSPESVGERGVTKFPHGVAIHALQLLPIAVFVMQFLKWNEAVRLRVAKYLSVSFLLQMMFAGYQTVNGLGRFELNSSVGIALLGGSVLVVAYPLIEILKRKFWFMETNR
ncbi:MAG: hypothetical protein AB8B55_24770 [Mariniblastus sp.]